MANNILDLFKLFLRQNYLIQNVERVLSDILPRSEFSSKAIEQYKRMISMVGSEQNVFEIIHNRLGDLNREDAESETKPLKNSLDLKSATQLDVKVKNVHNLNMEIRKNILQQNQNLGKSLLTNENDLNWLVQKNNPYESIFKKIRSPKTRVAVIISDSNSILNPKIVNQQTAMQRQKEILKQMGFFKGHFVIELQEVVKQNIFNVNQVQQSLINQLEEIMQVLCRTTLVKGNSAVQINSPVLYRYVDPIKSFPKKTSIGEKVNKINIKSIFDKGVINIKSRKSMKKTLVCAITPVSLNINVLANAVNIKGYKRFLRGLAEKNLSHKINVLGNSLHSDKSIEELLAKNLNILMNIINSDNKNLIKTIYLQQQVNRISNYMRFVNFLKFTEIYMAVTTVEQLNYLNLQYGETREDYIKATQKKENLLKELKNQVNKFKGIIKYEALDVNEFFKQLQPSFNYNLELKPQYFKNELIQYETTITNVIKENSESINPLKIIFLKNNYALLSYLKNAEDLFKKIKITNNINFKMEHVLNNFNDCLCHILSTDNSQWSRQIFPFGVKTKILLSGLQTPALHNKRKQSSNTGDNIKERKNILEINKKVFDHTEKKIKLIETLGKLTEKRRLSQKSNFPRDSIKERKNILEINEKVFDYTEKKIKLIEFLEKLKKKRRISQKSNPPLSGEATTSNKGKKTLNIQKDECSWAFSTHTSASKRNKMIFKIFYDIVKETIEGISVKKYLTSKVIIINNLKQKSNVINQNKTKVQNESANIHKSRVDILLKTPFQYRNNNALHFNQPTSSSNIDNNCTSTPLVVTQLKRLHTTNTISTKEINKTNNVNKIINVLNPKLEEIVTTLQTIETKQNTALNLLSIQLQEKCSKASNTNTKIISPVVHLSDEEMESLNQNNRKEDTDALLESNNAKDCKEEKTVKARNIHNEPPLYFKKYNKTSILPECTIWNTYTKSPIKINCNGLSKRIKSRFYFTKKYRYETKEVASPKGDKIKITCLVTDDEVNVQ